MKYSLRSIGERGMPAIFLALLWLSGMTFGVLAADEPDALGEPLTDQEVKEAVHDYLANSPDAKERNWIAQSGEGIEKKPVVHIKDLNTVKWGPWQVTPKTGEALLITKQNDRILQAVIRRKDGKAIFVKGEIWHHYSNGRASLSPIRR
jgi:hypothetical protein